MLEVIDISELKEHEQVEPIYLEKIKKQIQKDGVLKRPIRIIIG